MTEMSQPAGGELDDGLERVAGSEPVWIPPVPLDELDGEILAALRTDPLVCELAVDYAARAVAGAVREMCSWMYLLDALAAYRCAGGAVQCPLDSVGRVVREQVEQIARTSPPAAADAIRSVLDA